MNHSELYHTPLLALKNKLRRKIVTYLAQPFVVNKPTGLLQPIHTSNYYYPQGDGLSTAGARKVGKEYYHFNSKRGGIVSFYSI